MRCLHLTLSTLLRPASLLSARGRHREKRCQTQQAQMALLGGKSIDSGTDGATAAAAVAACRRCPISSAVANK
ncbi:hypothetical protein niasHT_032364 [Heterodera trifolii]|uniref:Secreted protein n=1 Tax=Heterodera trifolii TaxID=157864 RepID=A0ABD2HR88_9BILA